MKSARDCIPWHSRCPFAGKLSHWQGALSKSLTCINVACLLAFSSKTEAVGILHAPTAQCVIVSITWVHSVGAKIHGPSKVPVQKVLLSKLKAPITQMIFQMTTMCQTFWTLHRLCKQGKDENCNNWPLTSRQKSKENFPSSTSKNKVGKQWLLGSLYIYIYIYIYI